jgi:hypothetical protein
MQSAIAHQDQLSGPEMAQIRAGRLDALGPLVARNQALAETLADADPAALAQVRDLLGRNQVLLEAAIRGLRAARQRIAQIRGAGAGINSYDPNGQTRRIGASGMTVERRF